MWFAAHFDFVNSTCVGVKAVHGVVIPAAQPQVFAIGADVTHIWTAAAWNAPLLGDFLRCKINNSYAAWAIRRASDFVAATVSHIETFAIAARVNAMRTLARRNETSLLKDSPSTTCTPSTIMSAT